MFGTEINSDDLLLGEKVILSKNANVVIKISDYGLKKIPGGIDSTMSLIGFSGKEAIGGQLHLTNYRLIFKSHPANRLKGKFSIFLSTISSIKDTSVFISKKIEIKTLGQESEFIVWGITQLIQEINRNKSAITNQQLLELKDLITKNYTKIGTGLEYCKNVDILVQVIPNIGEILDDPISLSSLTNIIEILNIIDECNKKSAHNTRYCN